MKFIYRTVVITLIALTGALAFASIEALNVSPGAPPDAHDVADNPPANPVAAMIYIACDNCRSSEYSDEDAQIGFPWGEFIRADPALRQPHPKPGADIHVPGSQRYLAGFIYADVPAWNPERPYLAPQIYLLGKKLAETEGYNP